ncbi:DNA alkylation repair enzyme [gamma proteobacterium IMCC2047]|nr:DNA alkylation repair enzyme [gamma proteobacterium IMCC2047]
MTEQTVNSRFPLLKESLNLLAVQQIAYCLRDIDPTFDHDSFCQKANNGLEQLELKARVYHLIDALHQVLPQNFEQASQILCQVKQHQLEAKTPTIRAFTAWPLIDYVAVHGLQHPEIALKTLAQLTSLFSAEFAIRPFIQQHPELTFEYLHDWCNSADHHLRRLASEGTRPRLPWGQQLPQFIDNPAPILPILEKLNADSEDYVRRSVANNLNDISKDHPQTVLDTCKRWLEQPCNETQWIVRHATRTLVKQGDPEVFPLLGYTTKPQLDVTLTLTRHQLAIGENQTLQIQLKSKAPQSQNLLLDYAIHFMKANGQLSAKVFKLKTLTLPEGETLRLEKTHRFAPLSTRRYYSGVHKIEIKINGLSVAMASFRIEVAE